jgi:hypothetical protein
VCRELGGSAGAEKCYKLKKNKDMSDLTRGGQFLVKAMRRCFYSEDFLKNN